MLRRYTVEVERTQRAIIEVDARSEDDAIERATDAVDEDESNVVWDTIAMETLDVDEAYDEGDGYGDD